jgi:hypothetical protein
MNNREIFRKRFGKNEIEITSGEVKAHIDDWPRIRRLEKQLIGQRRANMMVAEHDKKHPEDKWRGRDHA